MTRITFKSNPIHTSGDLPKIGSLAPDFILTDKDLKERSLKDFHGKRKVLSFVPSLDTSVCSLSAKKFNQAMKHHKEAQMLIISADLPFAQNRICLQESLENITTLSLIRSKEPAKSYGVLITDGPLAGLCARAIVILDKDDRVLYTELVPEITHEPNYDKALEILFHP
jgi:thioredoxin-dependent peroxiredoxin